jgi:hypothetical protein
MNRTLAIVAILFILPLNALAQWDFSQHSIPLNEIQSGGPPRDGIPALTNPKYESGGNADYLRPDEQVLGVFLNGVARAYPIRILSWHEVVNDEFGGEPVLVSW